MRPRQQRHYSTVAMVVSGAAVAIVPATAQAVGSRLFSTGEQAALAIAIAVGAYMSAVLNGALLESRLSDPNMAEKTYIPVWAFAGGVAAGAALSVMPASAWAVICALPPLMVSLQLGRTHATVEHRWQQEVLAGALTLGGCSACYAIIVNGGRYGLSVLGISLLLTLGARQWRARSRVSEHAARARIAWVGSETAIVAATPLVINVAVLGLVGPEEAIAFRLILTVLGVLQPLLGYLRTILLTALRRSLAVALSVLSGVALLAVLGAHLVGLLDTLFGSSWVFVSTEAVAIACLWKLASVPANIPFASMRRQGAVVRVFAVRAASTLLYIVAGAAAAVIWASAAAVFLVFLVAELATLIMYTLVERRTRESRVSQDAS